MKNIKINFKNIVKVACVIVVSIIVNCYSSSSSVNEDYSNYLKYKNSLIQEYGKDTYELMNQEAGIKNENDSFNHYIKYGI